MLRLATSPRSNQHPAQTNINKTFKNVETTFFLVGKQATQTLFLRPPSLILLWTLWNGQVVLILEVCVGSFGEGNGNPLQHSRWENPKNRGASWATVRGVEKNQTEHTQHHGQLALLT